MIGLKQTATIKIVSGMLPIYIDDNGRLISISDRDDGSKYLTMLSFNKRRRSKIFESKIPSHVITLSERNDPSGILK